jgi:nucleoside-diphosphate-sugar epimerase
MRGLISGGAGFIGSHLVNRLLVRKKAAGVILFQFTSWERSRGRAVAAVRFHYSKIKALYWRTSGEAMKALLEEISYV